MKMFKTIFENAGNGNIRAIIIEIEAETGYRSVLDIAEYDGFSEKVQLLGRRGFCDIHVEPSRSTE